MTYRFPIPRDERVVMAIGVAVGVLVPVMVVYILVEVATSMQMSAAELLGHSPRLAIYLALLGLVTACAGYVLAAYAGVKRGERLEISAEELRYARPGVPVFGLFACDVVLAPGEVDRIVVRKARAGANTRMEVECGVGRASFRVNLEHAVGPTLGEPIRRQAHREDWLKHPLVTSLAEACSVSPHLA